MKKLTIFLIALIVFSCLLSSIKTYNSLTHPIKYYDEIVMYSDKYSVSPSLVASLINVESSYNPNAVSSKGAVGLGQILPTTAKYLNTYYHINNDTDLTNPATNIEYTCMYLMYLSNKFPSLKAILASYNAGETKVRSWQDADPNLDNIPYRETREYIKRIEKNMKFYSRVY